MKLLLDLSLQRVIKCKQMRCCRVSSLCSNGSQAQNIEEIQASSDEQRLSLKWCFSDCVSVCLQSSLFGKSML